MEGPSIVIACEELNAFRKKRILKASGTSPIRIDQLSKNSLIQASSWGKHLLLSFKGMHLRVHFLMFGSYRINDPRENRIPKLLLDYGDPKIYFYSCAIKEITPAELGQYDHSSDIMSKDWDLKKAVAKVSQQKGKMVCDLLMDQNIFSGLGNIMKNEILFNLKMHPETRAEDLTATRLKAMVAEARRYALQFYQ